MRLNSHKPPFLLQMFSTDALFFVNLHTNVNNIRHQFVMKGCDIFNPGEFETSRQQQVDAGFAFPIFAVSKAIILHFQDFCQSCMNGGEIVCCDWCPCAYHLDCAGLKEVPTQAWSCPHHRCIKCNRSSAAAGGLLFRSVS